MKAVKECTDRKRAANGRSPLLPPKSSKPVEPKKRAQNAAFCSSQSSLPATKQLSRGLLRTSTKKSRDDFNEGKEAVA